MKAVDDGASAISTGSKSVGLRSIRTDTNITESTLGSESTHSISPSKPAKQKQPGLFWDIIEQGRVYGRQREIKELHAAFERRVGPSAQPELIVLSGEDGVGKSALTRKAFVNPSSATCLVGKCDILKKPDPYAPFVQALSQYSDAGSSERRGNQFGEGKSEVGGSPKLGDRFDSLAALVPSLGQMPWDESHSTVTEGTSLTDLTYLHRATGQLKYEFKKVFQAISSVECPLILVLEDVQWADSSTLDLLETLASDPLNDGFVLVCTCLPLGRMPQKVTMLFERLEGEKSTIISNLEVQPLARGVVNEIVADVLQEPIEVCDLLSGIMYDCTKGNILFLIHLLRALYDGEVLLPDEKAQSWLWDEEKSNAFLKGNMTLMKLIEMRIRRLPSKSQLLLRTCACMGYQAEASMLSQVLVDTYIPEAALPALESDLFSYHADPPSTYSFKNSCVQKAAYSLIATDQKNICHLTIGRMLQKNLSPEELDSHLFLVVNQMSRGIAHLSSQNEKNDVAALCLSAGRKTSTMSDHESAMNHYLVGTTLVDSKSWSNQYHTSLELYTSLAEAAYMARDSGLMNFAVTEVLTNARRFRDKVRVVSTQVRSLGAQFMMEEAIELGLKILRLQGETFPSQATASKLLNQDRKKTKRLLKGKSDSDIVCLPDMHDQDKLGLMEMLDALVPLTYVAQPELLPFVASRTIKLTMEHGLCPMSAQGFALYAMSFNGMQEAQTEADSSYRYGNLALTILDRQGVIGAQRARVHGIVYGCVSYWKSPIQKTLQPTLTAYLECLEMGDTEFAWMSANLYYTNAFLAGQPLDSLRGEIESLVSRMSGHSHSLWANLTIPIQRLMRKLTKKAAEKSDEENAMLWTTVTQSHVPRTKMIDIIFQLVGAFYFGDYPLAIDLARQGHDVEKVLYNRTPLISLQLFYESLSTLAIAQNSSSNRNVHLLAGRKALKKLKVLADLSPKTLAHKVCLLEAEFAALNGSMDRAYKQYNLAIVLAEEEGFLQDQALACERAFLAFRGTKTVSSRAQPYLARAIKLYAQWGAHSKVDELRMY